jgi:predicted DsbA family dithiol-disulfide isomerase
MCPYSYFSNKALLDAIAECSHLPLIFNVEYQPYRLCSTLPEDFPIERKPYFKQKYGDKYEPSYEFIRRMAQALGVTM